MVDDTKVYADAWLSSNKSSDEITVAPYDAWGGAYEGRNITVVYAPFGNDRLNVITDKFNLTVKSEIFEGTFKYIGKSGTEAKPFEVDGGHTQDLLAKDFEKQMLMVLAMTLMTRELNLLYLNWQTRMLKIM